jgi:very-short-patch-repair endonuclease
MKTYIRAYTPHWLKKEWDYVAKLRKRSKKRRQRRELRDKVFQAIKNKAFQRANENRKCPTPTEAKFAQILDSLGVKYIQEYVYFYKKYKYRIIDFYLPDYRINVELDGGYHDDPEVKKYDEMKDQFTMIKTFRFKNETVYTNDFVDRFKNILIKRAVRMKKFKLAELQQIGVL